MSDATTPCDRVQGAAYGIQYFKIILCAQQILNHYVKFKKCDFLQFIISVEGDHCDYLPRAPKTLAAPMFMYMLLE